MPSHSRPSSARRPSKGGAAHTKRDQRGRHPGTEHGPAHKKRDTRGGPERGPVHTKRDPHAGPAHGKRDKHAGPKRGSTHSTRDPRDKHAAPARNPRDKHAAAGRPQHGKHGHASAGAGQGAPRHPHAPARGGHGAATESRIDPTRLAQALSTPAAPLRAGEWLWTTREGAERDLIEELLWFGDASIRPRLLAPSLVASAGPPPQRDGRFDLTFARQGFRVSTLVEDEQIEDLASQLVPSLRETVAGADRFALQVFVPDSDRGNTASARAQALRELIVREVPETLDEAQLRREGGQLAQLCVYDRVAALGCIAAEQAQSLWPGGRARMRLGGDFPSRAARKLAEAFAWLGMSPGSGELCVDLGAAPGGWSWLLLEKRARVIAVDPARMDAKLMRNPRLRHVQGNAFEYEPETPVDWLFCDMAYRPLEVAQMLGRWARRRHTRLLVANFKLPMKRKVEMVERIRGLLADSGFTSLRTRQLYHDREEITLTAHVR